MQVAIELIWPGVPVTACAIMLPRGSKTPAERSPDSRTTVVKDVRISAVACSLTTAISRFQSTSSVIGSMPRRVSITLRFSLQYDDQIAIAIDRDLPAADDRGRFSLLDHT